MWTDLARENWKWVCGGGCENVPANWSRKRELKVWDKDLEKCLDEADLARENWKPCAACMLGWIHSYWSRKRELKVKRMRSRLSVASASTDLARENLKTRAVARGVQVGVADLARENWKHLLHLTHLTPVCGWSRKRELKARNWGLTKGLTDVWSRKRELKETRPGSSVGV